MIRWYMSELSGKGTWDDPIHAAVWDATDPAKNELTGFMTPDKKGYLVRVSSSLETHDKIIAERKGRIVSPLFNDDIQEMAGLTPLLQTADFVLLPKSNKDWVAERKWDVVSRIVERIE